MPVKPGMILYFNYFSKGAFALYDINKKLIPNITDWQSPYTVPNNCYFIRASLLDNTISGAYFSTTNNYDSFKHIRPSLLELKNNLIEVSANNYTNTELNTATNLNSLNKNGTYTFSAATSITNKPDGSATGALINIINPSMSSSRHYQIYIDYESLQLYARCKKSGTFTNWFSPNQNNNILQYTYSKSGNDITIINRHCKYIVRHVIGTGVDNWRIYSAYFLPNHAIWVASDADGVIKIHGEADNLGGYHGDEITTFVKIFVDGVEINTDATISNTEYKTIDIITESNIYHANTAGTNEALLAFIRKKIIRFDSEGCKVFNNWELQDDFVIDNAFFGMLSVNRYDSENTDTEMITGFYTNVDYVYHQPGEKTELSRYLTQATVTTIYGDIIMDIRNTTQDNYVGFVEYYNQGTGSRNKVYTGPIIALGTGIAVEKGTVLRGETHFII